MRFRARLVLGLCGVALAVPAVVMAAPLGDDESAPPAVEMQGPPPARAEPHHHKGLFGRRHCVECQRARVKARDGVDVPAPPPLEPGVAAGVASSEGYCPTCQGRVVASAPAMSHDAQAPGYAVVGGPAGPEAPGYAVVGDAMAGSDPAPVGISKLRNSAPGDPRLAAMGGRGPLDPAVVPTNLPPPQMALTSPPSNRPHILTHLFGLDVFSHLRRDHETKERDKHASIAYGDSARPVTELPASMVYGDGSSH
jgi:hypothetical protein